LGRQVDSRSSALTYQPEQKKRGQRVRDVPPHAHCRYIRGGPRARLHLTVANASEKRGNTLPEHARYIRSPSTHAQHRQGGIFCMLQTWKGCHVQPTARTKRYRAHYQPCAQRQEKRNGACPFGVLLVLTSYGLISSPGYLCSPAVLYHSVLSLFAQ